MIIMYMRMRPRTANANNASANCQDTWLQATRVSWLTMHNTITCWIAETRKPSELELGAPHPAIHKVIDAAEAGSATARCTHARSLVSVAGI